MAIQFRSISLPSRLHPINSTNFESNLQKLNTTFLSKAVPISSESVHSALLCLAELYNSVEKLTQSPASQPSLILLEESILDGSVELLDSCNTIRELFQMIKENVQSLQSALRRKGLEHSSIQNDISTYLSFRKKMKCTISNSLKKLKILEKRINESSHSGNVLRQVTGVSIAIIKHVLLFFSSPTAPKSTRWNLVSRLILAKDCGRNERIMNDVGSVDFALNTFQGKIRNLGAEVVDGKMVQRSLKNLDSCIEEIETGLDVLFRQLIRSRVTLLNILIDH